MIGLFIGKWVLILIQAQEVIFSRKLQKSFYPPLHLNNIAVTQATTQKHLGMLLDVKLDFQGHLKI